MAKLPPGFVREIAQPLAVKIPVGFVREGQQTQQPTDQRQAFTFEQQFERVPEFVQDIGPVQAGFIGAGKGFRNIGLGAQRLLALVTGDTEEQKRLSETAQAEEEAFGQLRSQRPITAGGGEIVGEVAAFPVGGVGSGLVKRGLSSVVSGTLAGGLSEAGRGGTQQDISTIAAVGGALGPVGEAVGALASRIGPEVSSGVRKLFESKGIRQTDQLFSRTGEPTQEAISAIDRLNVSPEEFKAAFQDTLTGITQPAAEGLPAEQAFRIARAKKVGVDLTQGQTSREFADQSAEDTLKSLATEQGSEARGFFRQQQTKLLQAKNNFVKKLGGEIDATRAARGESLRTTLRELDSAEKENVRQLYIKLKDLPGGGDRIDVDGFSDVVDETINEFVPSDRVAKGIDNILKDFGIIAEGEKRKTFKGPLTFKNSEAMRKRFNRLSPTEPADIATVSILKRSFDDMFAASVDILPENTPIAQAAKKARNAAATRTGKFKNKDIIEDLISFKKGSTADRISDAEVFDKLFQGKKKLQNIKDVKRILTKNPTTESTQAWRNIQAQGALDILGRAVSETPDGFIVSGAKFNSAFDKFGEQELKTLLGDTAFKQFKSLKGVVGDATIPVPRTTNPSGTAAKLANIISKISAVQNVGILAQATSVLGVSAGAIKEASRRSRVLDGITKGATTKQKTNALLSLAAHVGTVRGGISEAQENK